MKAGEPLQLGAASLSNRPAGKLWEQVAGCAGLGLVALIHARALVRGHTLETRLRGCQAHVPPPSFERPVAGRIHPAGVFFVSNATDEGAASLLTWPRPAIAASTCRSRRGPGPTLAPHPEAPGPHRSSRLVADASGTGGRSQ
jgi:hypothetical protein